MAGGEKTKGVKNGNWKGGRSIASNGYVLVRVGTDHRLADVRGYAYEHRLVAEAKLGRRLRRGEVVHHVDGDKTNNVAPNIEVLPSIAHHLLEHRNADSKRRRPGERNPKINCKCDCGTKLRKFDESGRPRRFISGHNGRLPGGSDGQN